jgi:hypothetical protein
MRTLGARFHAPVDVMIENPSSQPTLSLSIHLHQDSKQTPLFKEHPDDCNEEPMLEPGYSSGLRLLLLITLIEFSFPGSPIFTFLGLLRPSLTTQPPAIEKCATQKGGTSEPNWALKIIQVAPSSPGRSGSTLSFFITLDPGVG